MDGRTSLLPALSATRALQAAALADPARLTLPGAFSGLPPGCDHSASAEPPPIAGLPPETSLPACGSAARRSPGRISSWRLNGFKPVRALQPAASVATSARPTRLAGIRVVIIVALSPLLRRNSRLRLVCASFRGAFGCGRLLRGELAVDERHHHAGTEPQVGRRLGVLLDRREMIARRGEVAGGVGGRAEHLARHVPPGIAGRGERLGALPRTRQVAGVEGQH